MSVEDIASYVAESWATDELRGLSHEGLRYVLMKVVAEEPERFATARTLCRGSSPIYIQAVLQGLREAVLAGRPFPWPPVLGFCEQLISRQGIASGSSGEEEFTDSEVVGLLRSAFKRDQVPIPIELRPSVWAIIERLARSPEPSSEAPLVHPDASHLKTAPFNITTRVQVLDLVFSYGIWTIRDIMNRSTRHNIERSEPGKDPRSPTDS